MADMSTTDVIKRAVNPVFSFVMWALKIGVTVLLGLLCLGLAAKMVGHPVPYLNVADTNYNAAIVAAGLAFALSKL